MNDIDSKYYYYLLRFDFEQKVKLLIRSIFIYFLLRRFVIKIKANFMKYKSKFVVMISGHDLSFWMMNELSFISRYQSYSIRYYIHLFVLSEIIFDSNNYIKLYFHISKYILCKINIFDIRYLIFYMIHSNIFLIEKKDKSLNVSSYLYDKLWWIIFWINLDDKIILSDFNSIWGFVESKSLNIH